MSNIRTLADLERSENTQALPNPWTAARPSGATSGGSAYNYDHSQPDVREYGPTAGFRAQYINCNGETVSTEPEDTGIRLICLNCCPCFVDPCGEKRRSEWRKALCSFTLPISIVQFIMLIVAIGVGHGFVSYADNPAVGPGGDTFLILGAKYGPYIREGQVWRFITPIFLHAGIFHLLMNVLAQLRFGLFLERKWGTIKYTIIYLVSGIGASLMSCLLNFFSTSVGASGAIMGLFGAYLAYVILTWHKTPQFQRVATLVQTVVWIGITMLFGISKFVDTAAHFGGALTGFVFGLALLGGEERDERRIALSRGFGIALTTVYFVLGLVLLYTLPKYLETVPPPA